MDNIIKFLIIDSAIQKILLFFTFLSILFFPFVGVMLCVLGAWQLFSAAIVGYTLKDKIRARYFVLSILYLCFMWVAAFTSKNEYDFALVAMAFIFIVIPIFIALWYMQLTNRTLERLNNDEYLYSGKEGLEDVLDSDVLLENRKPAA